MTEPVAPPLTMGWYVPWQDPVRVKPPTHLTRQHLGFQGGPEAVHAQWFVPWTDPVWSRAGLLAHLQQFLAWEPVFAVAENITVDKWFVPWQDPPKPRPRAPVFMEQGYDETQQFPESVTIDRWLNAWSEPVRARLRTAEYPQPVLGEVSLGSPANILAWYRPWDDPVRKLPRAADFPQPVLGVPPLTMEWYRQWENPVWPKKGLAAYLQPDTTGPHIALFAELITVDKWYVQWRDPVRFLPRDCWYQHQEMLVIQPIIDIVKTFAWAREQWEYPQAYLIKRGLGVQFQQAQIMTMTGIVISITGSMAATEQLDLLFVGGQSFNSPVSALVGVHQNLPNTPS